MHPVFIIGTLISLSSSPLLAEIHPWSDLVGCYRTLIMDGVEKSTDKVTRISFTDYAFRGFVESTSGEPIPSLELKIALGPREDDPRWNAYLIHSVFAELGKYSIGEDGERRYQFSGGVVYRWPDEKRETVDFESSAMIRLKDGELALTYQTQTKTLDGKTFADSHVISLKKAECPKPKPVLQ